MNRFLVHWPKSSAFTHRVLYNAQRLLCGDDRRIVYIPIAKTLKVETSKIHNKYFLLINRRALVVVDFTSSGLAPRVGYNCETQEEPTKQEKMYFVFCRGRGH